MNISDLFQMQKALDEKIVQEKGLEGQDFTTEKVLALIVELGECANEFRMFKFWSTDQEPRTEVHKLKKEYKHLHITQTGAYEYQLRDEFGNVVESDVTDYHHDITNPLLEEYVDVVHFAISLAIQFRVEADAIKTLKKTRAATQQFIHCSAIASGLQRNHFYEYGNNTGEIAKKLLEEVLHLGELLEFTEDEIEAAYFSKNATNIVRQETNY